MKTTAKDLSTADLKAELERREALNKAGPRPKVVAKPDFTGIVRMFEEHHDLTERGEMHDDSHSSFQHYLYETVAQALYGPNYFKWWNKIRS